MVKTRSNSQWLTELPSSSAAAEELQTFLRRGLAKALRKQGVGDSDLDDFAQEAVLRVLEGLAGFRGDSQFTTWAMAVALRGAFGSLRARRYDPSSLDAIELVQADPSAADPADNVERGDLLKTLGLAIEHSLTERQRTAVLAELAGAPTALLAERLDIKPNALYKLHHDARKKLRLALERAGFRDEDVRQQLAKATKQE